MVLFAGVVLWRVYAQDSVTNWVEHSAIVLLHAKDAELDLSDMNLAFRGYMASSDKAYLADLQKATDAFEEELETLAALVTDNADQERRLIRVSKVYIPGRFEELIKERDAGTPRSNPIVGAQTYSRQVLDALNAFIAAEYQLRARRTAQLRGLDRVIVGLVLLLSAVIVVALSYEGWRQIRGASQQYAAALNRA